MHRIFSFSFCRICIAIKIESVIETKNSMKQFLCDQNRRKYWFICIFALLRLHLMSVMGRRNFNGTFDATETAQKPQIEHASTWISASWSNRNELKKNFVRVDNARSASNTNELDKMDQRKSRTRTFILSIVQLFLILILFRLIITLRLLSFSLNSIFAFSFNFSFIFIYRFDSEYFAGLFDACSLSYFAFLNLIFCAFRFRHGTFQYSVP